MVSRRPQSTPVGLDDNSLSSLGDGSCGRNRSQLEALQTRLARFSADSWLFAFESQSRLKAPSRPKAQQRALTPINSWIGSPTATQPAQGACHKLLLQHQLHSPSTEAFQMRPWVLSRPSSAQIQAQSAQISDLMQIVKGLGRLQEQTLVASTQATPATGAEEKTGDESAPMEVDKDTGGVRHSKAEQYLPKILMLNEL